MFNFLVSDTKLLQPVDDISDFKNILILLQIDLYIYSPPFRFGYEKLSELSCLLVITQLQFQLATDNRLKPAEKCRGTSSKDVVFKLK